MRGRPGATRRIGSPPRNTPAYAGKTRRRQECRQKYRKHPRVCGEDSVTPTLSSASGETPPRMRGRLSGGEALFLADRNTPAYAGKTIRMDIHIPTNEKHPRVCGEDSSFASVLSTLLETPPRMRGRPIRICITRGVQGNTPAYAGKTYKEAHKQRCNQKHPRVCGEDFSTAISLLRFIETPPRMRGRLRRSCSCSI